MLQGVSFIAALTMADLSHRESAFTAIFRDICDAENSDKINAWDGDIAKRLSSLPRN
jgi:hypothetical protein